MVLSVISKQVYATFDVLCLSYVIGFNTGMMSVMIPSLRHSDSGIQLTADEESWIVSLQFLLMFLAQMVGAFASDWLGRRRVVTFSLLPPAISFILIYCARSSSTLLAASTIFGLMGGGSSIGPALVAETSSPKCRGVLLSTKPLLVILGICTAHLLEKFFYWRHVVLVGLAPCLLGLVTSLSSPKSPEWLAARGRFRECERAFQWLRGAEDAAELRALVDSQRAARQEKELNSTSRLTRNTIQYLTDKCFLKAIVISFACNLMLESFGILYFYILDLIIMITADKDSAHYVAVGLDLINIVGCVISCFLVKFVKRRFLLFSTAAPAICLLLLFCLTSLLISQSIIPSVYKWLQLALLLLFFLVADIGFPVTYSIIGEIFPLSHRGLGAGIVGLLFNGVAFVGTKILPSLISMLEIHGAFLVIDIVIIVSLTYLYIFLPETGDKTLQDIEYDMGRKNVEVPNETKISS